MPGSSVTAPDPSSSRMPVLRRREVVVEDAVVGAVDADALDAEPGSARSPPGCSCRTPDCRLPWRKVNSPPVPRIVLSRMMLSEDLTEMVSGSPLAALKQVALDDVEALRGCLPLLLPPPAPDEAREAQWFNVLGRYYHELGIDPGASLPVPEGRLSAKCRGATRAVEARGRQLSLRAASRGARRRVKAWGAEVVSSATTVDEARWLEAHGADA